jgi:hypothetical protein
MWTNVSREDRYLKNKWETHGNIYTQGFYDKNFIKKFTDDRGFLIRDLAVIAAVLDLLEYWKVNYAFLSMVPLDNKGQYECERLPDQDILNLYKHVLLQIRPSIYEAIFNFDWYSRFSPEEYALYSGSSWPSYKEFMGGSNGSDVNIQNEIKRFRKNYLKQNVEIDHAGRVGNLFNDGGRHDTHARPQDHLEYLQQILPEINISSETLTWVQEQHINAVVHKRDFVSDLPKRF